jgi:Fe2+ transport system protein FeoA
VLVSNSELATRVSAELAPVQGRGWLADAAVGRRLRVVAIDLACRASLSPEGIDVGVEVSVERRLALGGPLIVRLGRTRLAIARSLAAGVFVEPAEVAKPGC